MLIAWIDEILCNNPTSHLKARDVTVEATAHLRPCKAAGRTELTGNQAAVLSKHQQDRLLDTAILRLRMPATTIVAEVGPPRTTDESGLACEELPIDTVALLHNRTLPLPQRPVPAAIGHHHITAVIVDDVLCRIAHDAAVQKWQKTHLLNICHQLRATMDLFAIHLLNCLNHCAKIQKNSVRRTTKEIFLYLCPHKSCITKNLKIMKVGIPKEIKNNENRVGMTPAGVAELARRGHEVSVQHTAGEGSGFSDDDYVKAGARILPTIEAVYRECDMIVKVKEPIEPEYELVRPGQLLFTYFHFACEKELTEAMLKSGAVCLAYETVQLPNGSLPLLQPMSEVAGRMATLNGAYYLQKTKGGKGKLISGVPGVSPAKVLVLGGGVVGEAAALMAAGLGADVTIADISLPRLRQLDIETPANVHTLYSSEHNIRQQLPTVDIIVGSVLVPGDKTPHLITKEMLKLMEPGTVLVDVAIDQGGCFETSRPTTHSDPVYIEDGIVHYCVANIPGAVPNTSTLALTNATLRYAIALADKGWQQACKDDAALAKGLNIVEGKVVFKAVADVFGLPWNPLS